MRPIHLCWLGLLPLAMLFGSCGNEASVGAGKADTAALRYYAAHLHQALDPDLVTRISGKPAGELKVFYDSTGADVSSDYYMLSWPSPTDPLLLCRLGSGRMVRCSKDVFIQMHSRVEGNALQSQMDALASDSSIDPEVARWELRDLAKTSALQRFEPVTGLGEAAIWEPMRNALHVFDQGMSFTVFAKLGTDETRNLSAARELAVHLLSKSLPQS